MIEILITIAIMSLLAGLSIPFYRRHLDTARVASSKADIKTIEKEILSFSIENDRFPNDLSEVGFGNILDPYGTPYQYQPSTYIDPDGNVESSANRREDRNNIPVNTDFDLFSMGKDGQSAAPFTASESLDDIVRAKNGLFIGKASVY